MRGREKKLRLEAKEKERLGRAPPAVWGSIERSPEYPVHSSSCCLGQWKWIRNGKESHCRGDLTEVPLVPSCR